MVTAERQSCFAAKNDKNASQETVSSHRECRERLGWLEGLVLVVFFPWLLVLVSCTGKLPPRNGHRPGRCTRRCDSSILGDGSHHHHGILAWMKRQSDILAPVGSS